jgi:CrcB protein
MKRLLLLAVAGGLGTLARYAVDGWISTHPGRHAAWPATFPLGTMAVNVSGCFLIGILAAVSGPSLGRAWISAEWRDLSMIGFCGGFTTFSAYALQTMSLARDAQWLACALNVLGSNGIGLLAVYAGRVCGLVLQSRIGGAA